VTESFHSSDTAILDLLRRRHEATVSELADAMDVTATAVRQRLQRLMFQGFIRRIDRRQSRGRPTHGYSLTSSGRRKAGENFADLATVLWEEVRAIEDDQVRQTLIQGVARRLAKLYARQVHGESVAERMESIALLFGERQIPISVEHSEGHDRRAGAALRDDSEGNAAASQRDSTAERRAVGPVLIVLACPYPDLTAADDSICRMEKTLLSELVGTPLELGECTLSGGHCCRFTVVPQDSSSEGDTTAREADLATAGSGRLSNFGATISGGAMRSLVAESGKASPN